MRPTLDRVSSLLVAALLLSALPIGAADRPLSARRLTLRRTTRGKHVVLTSRDGSAVFPATGSAGNLMTTGVTIELISPSEGNAIVTIPPGSNAWRRTAKAYRFTNPAAPAGASPVHSFQLRKGVGIKLDLRDVGLPLAAPLGSVGVRVTYGSERVCMLFGGTTIRRDLAGRFLAVDAAAAATCNASDLGGPLVCGNGDVESGEVCDGSVPDVCLPNFYGGCGAPGTPQACQCCVITGGFCGANGRVLSPCCDPAAGCEFRLSPEIPGFCTLPTLPPPPFPGCDATGTWSAFPFNMGLYVIESAGGVLSAVSFTSPDLSTYQLLPGSRQGARIVFGDPAVFTGTQISCTEIGDSVYAGVGLTRVRASTCGDGNLDAGTEEQCDDGNQTAGDCCSPTCQTEAGCP